MVTSASIMTCLTLCSNKRDLFFSTRSRPALGPTQQIHLGLFPSGYEYLELYLHSRNRDSAVGMATGYGLVGRGVGVLIPAGARDFSLLHCVQTCSGAHPAPYAGSLPGGKAARASSSPLTSNLCRGQEYVDLYIHSPIRLHGVVLNQAQEQICLCFAL
jgi:hypothetical protein